MKNIFHPLIGLAFVSLVISSAAHAQNKLVIANSDLLTYSANAQKQTEDMSWQLVWSDEFDYTGLPDSKKWSYDTDGNASGWGNKERQYYTSTRLKNSEVKNGCLYIHALKEDYEGKKYTSARLATRKKGDWLYGKIEVRAKLPEGRGLWPAIWMMPTDAEYGHWPASGEIDIMENVGYNPNVIVATAHTKSYNHVIGTQKGANLTVADCYSEFHDYTLEWEAGEYRVYVDTTLVFTFKNEGKGYQVWPFDKPFYLLLNVAVGGNWGGQKGIDNSIFPQSMLVDYVRVYQKKK
ncbi:MAG: glycoside hydrolase family 16 protein [Prolixibacteraceae bacterium]|jgi:beta-glucanase (GH16 family)